MYICYLCSINHLYMLAVLRSVQFYLLILLGLAPVLRGHAQGAPPAWESAVTLGQRPLTADGIRVEVTKTAPDGQGNLYVTGYYTGRVTFGATTLESIRNPDFPAGTGYSDDIFVAKYSLSTNRYLWAISAGGLGVEGATQLVVSGSNLYVAGNTRGQARYSDALTFGSTVLHTTTHLDIFVAKLTDTGTGGAWQWAKLGASTYFTNVVGLGVNGTSVYLAGDFADVITFDTKQLSTSQLGASNAGDLLLVKFLDAGSSASVGWAKQLGGISDEQAGAFFSSGPNLYFGASYYGTTTIGTITLPNLGTRTSADALVAKIVDTGSSIAVSWVQRLGGTGSDYARSLVLAGATLYVAGDFSSPQLAVGANQSLTNPDATGTVSQLFLARLTDAGTSSSFDWAQLVGGNGAQATLLMRSGSTCYLAGVFSGTTATFGTSVLPNAGYSGSRDAFVLRLDETNTGATLAWVKQIATSSYDLVNALHVLSGRLYVQGYTDGVATFGATTLPLYSSFLSVLGTNSPLAAAGSSSRPGVALYPNPAHGSTTVQLPAQAGPVTLTLLDALGRVVSTCLVAVPASGCAYSLDVSGLPVGVYSLRVHVGDAATNYRLAVQ